MTPNDADIIELADIEVRRQCYPVIEVLADGYLRRSWLMKTRDAVPEQPELDAAVAPVRAQMLTLARSYFGQDLAYPRVGLSRVVDRELVTMVDVPTGVQTFFGVRDPARSGQRGYLSDIELIGTWVVLRGVDRLWRLEWLQGLPAASWGPIYRGRDSAGRSGRST